MRAMRAICDWDDDNDATLVDCLFDYWCLSCNDTSQCDELIMDVGDCNDSRGNQHGMMTMMMTVIMTTLTTTVMTRMMTTMITVMMTTMITVMMTTMMTVMFSGATRVAVFERRQDLQSDLLWQYQLWRAAGGTSLLSYMYTCSISHIWST